MRAWPALAAWTLSMASCVQFEKGDEGGGEEGPAATSQPATTTASDPSTGGPGDPTLTPTTGGDPTSGDAQCDLWAQDCPEGTKCTPYDKDNDGIHDTERCVPIHNPSGQAGDDCTVEGSVASGIDTCDLGLLCWNTDAQNKGRCVPMCYGSLGAPQCDDGLLCDISNGGALLLCVTPCDPLTPSCPIGQICLPGGEQQFICDVDASGDQGGYGDACAYINVCDQGLLCVSGQSVPGCGTDGCCTEYCDLSAAEFECAGAPAQECVPFYDDDSAPPGYENVGVCAIPA